MCPVRPVLSRVNQACGVRPFKKAFPVSALPPIKSPHVLAPEAEGRKRAHPGRASSVDGAGTVLVGHEITFTDHTLQRRGKKHPEPELGGPGLGLVSRELAGPASGWQLAFLVKCLKK